MTKVVVSSVPVIRSVEVPNGHRMVIVRRDAFQTAVSASSAPQVAISTNQYPGRPSVGEASRKRT